MTCVTRISAILLFIASMTAHVRAQENLLELVRQHGPNPNLLNPETITMAMEMLRWQQAMHTAEIQEMEKLLARWQQQASERQGELAAVRQAAREAGLPFSLTYDALGRLGEQSVEATINLRALAVKQRALQEWLQAAQAEGEEAAQQERQSRVNQLRRQIVLLTQELARLQRLHEHNAVSEAELLRAQHALDNAQVELDEAMRVPAPTSEPVLRIKEHLQLASAELHQIETLREELERRLTEAEIWIERGAQLQSQLETYQRMVQEGHAEIARIELVRAQLAALLALCEERLKDQPPVDRDDRSR